MAWKRSSDLTADGETGQARATYFYVSYPKAHEGTFLGSRDRLMLQRDPLMDGRVRYPIYGVTAARRIRGLGPAQTRSGGCLR